MNLLILGPQGSGKGTQAKLLADKLGLYYFDMGAFLREMAKANQEIQALLQAGTLIPDELFFLAMKELLQAKIQIGKGLILDGFPRTLNQYGILNQWFADLEVKIDKIIFLAISDQEVVRRLSARRNCLKCGRIYNLVLSPKPKDPRQCDVCGGELSHRSDDQPEVIAKRLATFKQETLPVIDLARKDGLLVEVNGEQSISEVAAEIQKYLPSSW